MRRAPASYCELDPTICFAAARQSDFFNAHCIAGAFKTFRGCRFGSQNSRSPARTGRPRRDRQDERGITRLMAELPKEIGRSSCGSVLIEGENSGIGFNRKKSSAEFRTTRTTRNWGAGIRVVCRLRGFKSAWMTRHIGVLSDLPAAIGRSRAFQKEAVREPKTCLNRPPLPAQNLPHLTYGRRAVHPACWREVLALASTGSRACQHLRTALQRVVNREIPGTLQTLVSPAYTDSCNRRLEPEISKRRIVRRSRAG